MRIGLISDTHGQLRPQPLAEERGGALYLNPGSAGPRRFRLPVTAGELLVSGPVVTPRIVDLLEPAA